MYQRRFFLLLLILAGITSIADERIDSTGGDPGVLRFGLVTAENPAIIFEKFTPLISLLSDSIDIPIEFYQTTSHRETQEAFENGTVDLGIINALSYVAMWKNPEIIPIAARVKNGVTVYRTYIVVKNDGSIYSYGELKGKVFAMGDPYSTSATFMPKIMLRNSGIDPENDLLQVRTFSKQDSILYAILNRTVDAGAVASFVFDEFDDDVTGRLRIIDQSAAFPLGPLIIQKHLGRELISTIRSTLLSLHTTPAGRRALDKAELDSFAAVDADDYQWIAELLADNFAPATE